MLVIRIAKSDPVMTTKRAIYLEEHKSYLRSSDLKIIFSGPLHDAQGIPVGGMILANVDQIDDAIRFNEKDPFVINAVYSTVEILRWETTIANPQSIPSNLWED